MLGSLPLFPTADKMILYPVLTHLSPKQRNMHSTTSG